MKNTSIKFDSPKLSSLYSLYTCYHCEPFCFNFRYTEDYQDIDFQANHRGMPRCGTRRHGDKKKISKPRHARVLVIRKRDTSPTPITPMEFACLALSKACFSSPLAVTAKWTDDGCEIATPLLSRAPFSFVRSQAVGSIYTKVYRGEARIEISGRLYRHYIRYSDVRAYSIRFK